MGSFTLVQGVAKRPPSWQQVTPEVSNSNIHIQGYIFDFVKFSIDIMIFVASIQGDILSTAKDNDSARANIIPRVKAFKKLKPFFQVEMCFRRTYVIFIFQSLILYYVYV